MTDDQSAIEARRPRVLTILGSIVLILFAASLVLLWNLPLYVDEPQWKLIGSSLFNDNFVLRYFWPACSGGYILPVPVSWGIPRVIDSLLYGNMGNLGIIRPIGIATCIGIVGAIAAIFYRTAGQRVSVFSSLVALIALSSFGVIVPLLVMNRPEQSLLVPFVAMMLISVFRPTSDRAPSLAISIVWCLLFSLLTSMMLAQHIKSFVLLPAVGLAAFLVIRRTWPVVVFAGASLFSFYETYTVWAKRTDCPELPMLQEAFNKLSLSPHLLMTSPLSFLSTAIRNTAGSWIYILSGSFAYSYQSQWLPIDDHSALIENFSNLLLVLAVALIVVTSLWSAYNVVRTTNTWSQRLRDPGLLGLVIVLGLALLLPYQSTKNFYETALFWPLLLLVFALSAGRLVHFARRIPRLVIASALVAVIVSQATLVVVLQDYQGAWQQHRTDETVALADVQEVGLACGLKQGQDQAGLVVNNVAHQVFWKTSRPVLADYVIGGWALGLDLHAAAKDWPINAILAECRTIPADLLPQSKRSADGLYCCAQL